jgi:hypothetical protein
VGGRAADTDRGEGSIEDGDPLGGRDRGGANKTEGEIDMGPGQGNKGSEGSVGSEGPV